MGSHSEVSHFVDQDAIDWARTFASFKSTELVSDAPWARTHKLVREAESHYLKVLPPHQAKVIKPVAALASRFPASLPRLLAHDAAHGWLLSADHGGRALDYDAADADIRTIATTYASLQADAAKLPALFAGLPQPTLEALPQKLLDFLQALPTPATGGNTGTVGAAYFIGSEEAQQFHQSLQARLGLIAKHLQAAAELPLTINHGDLRPPNAAIAGTGDCVILDWDDAIVGPAGMSLHGLFEGCAVPTILLSGSPAAEAAASTPNGLLVHAYVDTLAQAGYASRVTLHRALPAAMVAGMIQFILNFAAYPGEGEREAVGHTMETRLADLLDICDMLASRDPATALAMAQDYEDHEQDRRAQYLLQDHALRHPEDLATVVRLGAVLWRRENLEQAEQTYREAIARAPKGSPHTAALHAGLGAVLMSTLRLVDGRKALQRALKLDPTNSLARSDLDRLLAMQAMQADAAVPEHMPRLVIPAADAAAGVLRPDMQALGAALFDEYGTLQIDNAFAAADIARLHDAFIARYEAYFREDEHPDALRLGDKRYMLTVDFENEFAAPGVVGAPMVLPIIRKLLGDDCVLGAYTAVISLPGSQDQRLHKDHPALFPDTQWHYGLPCFAAQIIIPLVPLNEMTGTTRFYKGTHRSPTEEAEAKGAQDPQLPLGSCLLTDYRCAHRGRGNRSEQVRPILTLIYNRPWFRDYKNYNQQPPLRISDSAYEQMPDDLQRMVTWWKEERKNDALTRSVLGH